MMGKTWSYEKREWVEQTAWCPQCHSTHALLPAKYGQPKRLCPVSEDWRRMHYDESLIEWKIRCAWAAMERNLRQAEATRRRSDGPMYTVACPGCHTHYQSYDSTGTRCVNCSMERE